MNWFEIKNTSIYCQYNSLLGAGMRLAVLVRWSAYVGMIVAAILFLIPPVLTQDISPSFPAQNEKATDGDVVKGRELFEQFRQVEPRLNLRRYQQLLKDIQNTGVVVLEADYRWQVGIRVTAGGGWRCGGILISRQFVLTAAHCMDRNSGLTGTAELVPQSAIQIFHGTDSFGAGSQVALDPDWPVRVHPGWRATDIPTAYDAALIRLAQPLNEARPAPVRSVAFGEGRAVVSGWGSFDDSDQPSTYLRAVELPIVHNDICQAALDPERAGRIGDWSLCTISTTDHACSRDSGGPLVIGTARHPQTVGIVSWGAQDICGQLDSLGALIGVFTRASKISAWVAQTTGDPATVTASPPGPLFRISPGGNVQ